MSRPSHHEIAAALGISAAMVSRLERRGMPVWSLARARAWFERNGLRPAAGRWKGFR